MSGGPFVTSEQVAAAREEAAGGWVKLYSKPQAKYEGPYLDVVAVFEEKDPVLIAPDGSREKMLVEWTAGTGS